MNTPVTEREACSSESIPGEVSIITPGWPATATPAWEYAGVPDLWFRRTPGVGVSMRCDVTTNRSNAGDALLGRGV
jgi:hypothetical protein